MVVIPDFVDAVRRQQRAARHTVSLTLGVHAIAMGLLAAVNSPFGWGRPWAVLVPAVVYLVLWLVVRIRQPLTGMGGGRDGFGVMAVLALAVALFFPFSIVAVVMVGAGTFLGLGLVVIGARMRVSLLWGPGIALMALCPPVALFTFDNHVAFLGDHPGTVVLAALAAVLAAASGYAYLAERSTLRSTQLP